MAKQENTASRLIEFKFNTDQTYLLECTYGCIRFYSYDANGVFGAVTNENGQVLEIEQTDYTDQDFLECQYAQNGDVMVFVSPYSEPFILERRGADTFTWDKHKMAGLPENAGNPTAVAFHKGRLWLAGFEKKPTTVVASGFADYWNFVVKTTDVVATDPLSFTLTDVSDRIKWLYGGKKNLIAGNSEGVSALNGGNVDTPITATQVNADLTNKEGCSRACPVEKDSNIIYVGLDKEKVYSFSYDLMSESFISSNLNLLSEQVGQIEELQYKRDENNLIYGRTSAGQMIALLYNKAENIVGWFPITTQGTVKSICTVTRPDGKDDLFICVERANHMYIERLCDEVRFAEFDETKQTQEQFHREQLAKLGGAIYLDSSISLTAEPFEMWGKYYTDPTDRARFIINHEEDYNTFTEADVGRKVDLYPHRAAKIVRGEISQIIYDDNNNAIGFYFTDNPWSRDGEDIYMARRLIKTIADLDDIKGEEQSVFANGGYVGTYTVDSNGQITLDNEYESVVIGFAYRGLAKTFNIGTWYNGVNYQTAKKRVVSFTVRLLNTGSLKIGTSLSNMQQLCEFKPGGFYDSAPLLANADVSVYGYNDTHSTEKCIYLLQDEPTPCCLTMIDCDVTFNKLK
jgi:hypothetical protein